MSDHAISPIIDYPAALATGQSGRVEKPIGRERRDGLKLALQLRVAVMVIVAAYPLSFGWSSDRWVNLAAS